MAEPDAWLRGPVPGVDPLLVPAAHAFIQAGEDAARAAADLSVAELWAAPPGGAAAIGFHLRHMAGATERLLTYARGVPLTPEQIAAAKAEAEPGPTPPGAAALLGSLDRAISGAVAELRATPREKLLAARTVGRAALPTTVLGLLFHAAEHAQRHAGQLVTTAKVLRGLR
jgi:uncharacterized damage-inducible protein DinB